MVIPQYQRENGNNSNAYPYTMQVDDVADFLINQLMYLHYMHPNQK
jgi:hypothetical protein